MQQITFKIYFKVIFSFFFQKLIFTIIEIERNVKELEKEIVGQDCKFTEQAIDLLLKQNNQEIQKIEDYFNCQITEVTKEKVKEQKLLCLSKLNYMGKTLTLIQDDISKIHFNGQQIIFLYYLQHVIQLQILVTNYYLLVIQNCQVVQQKVFHCLLVQNIFKLQLQLILSFLQKLYKIKIRIIIGRNFNLRNASSKFNIRVILLIFFLKNFWKYELSFNFLFFQTDLKFLWARIISYELQYIVNVVTPIYENSDQIQQNFSSIRNNIIAIFNVANQKGIKSLAIPLLGCGACGFAFKEAAGVIVNEVINQFFDGTCILSLSSSLIYFEIKKYINGQIVKKRKQIIY